MKSITWNRARLEELRAAHKQAVQDRKNSFTVKITDQGSHVFDVGFARHTIAYLDQVFAENPPVDFGPNKEGKEGE